MKNLILKGATKALIGTLGFIAITGIIIVFYTLITDPLSASNATWGVFDTFVD